MVPRDTRVDFFGPPGWQQRVVYVCPDERWCEESPDVPGNPYMAPAKLNELLAAGWRVVSFELASIKQGSGVVTSVAWDVYVLVKEK